MKVTQDLLQTQININRKQIDILEKSMKLSSFNPSQSFETLEKQVGLLEEQIKLQTKMGEELNKQKDYYKNRLISFGIKFDDKGIAQNAEQVLDKIKNQMSRASDDEELSKLEEKYSDYSISYAKYCDGYILILLEDPEYSHVWFSCKRDGTDLRKIYEEVKEVE